MAWRDSETLLGVDVILSAAKNLKRSEESQAQRRISIAAKNLKRSEE
jgi:hypothetical protein